MQDMLLLAAMAAVFTYGWFLMGKLDGFLEEDHHMQELQPAYENPPLRPGFVIRWLQAALRVS